MSKKTPSKRHQQYRIQQCATFSGCETLRCQIVHLLSFKIHLWKSEVKSNVNATSYLRNEIKENVQWLAVDLAHTFLGLPLDVSSRVHLSLSCAQHHLKTPLEDTDSGVTGLPARC